MWHVIANVDTEFDSIQECLRAYGAEKGEYPLFIPSIPETRSPSEDAVVSRIPVCERLEDCFTAIGLLGRFRRCLATNEDAKSYVEGGGEVYPVLICQFGDSLPVYRPEKAEVWDVEKTHELWLLQPSRPADIQLRWLTPYSILWDDDDCFVCKVVRFATSNEVTQGIHPWLTGTGNILESSLMDYDWMKARYRKPWSEAEISLVREGYLHRNFSVESIQCQMVPYRSKREIHSLLEKEGILS